jgi:spermidine/putrescine transport system permease protein
MDDDLVERGKTMKAGWFRTYAIGYLVFLYAPIVLLPLFAFNDAAIIAFPLSGFTMKWFTALTHEPALHQAAKNSLIIAVCASIFSTILGIFAARASTRYRFPFKGGIIGMIMLPLVLPEIILAVALLVVMLGLNIPLSIFTVILGHVLVCTPFSIAILSAAFQALDNSLEEAAYDLGETSFSTFRLIILPLVMPGIISSLLITFTISLDEFIMAFFLAGTEATLPVYIFSQFRFPKSVPVIMALGTILVVLSVILLATAEYFRRRGIAKNGGSDTGGFL